MEAGKLSNPEEDLFHQQFQKMRSIPKSKRAAYQSRVNRIKVTQGKPKVIYFEDEFTNQDEFIYGEHRLHFHYIQQTKQPSAVCVFIHGMNSHGGRSAFLAKNITETNPSVNFFALDIMNFGQSGGDMRGYWHPLAQVANQGQAFVDYVLKRFSNKPKVYLVAMSLGATVCLQMTLNRQFFYKGVIFLSPAFGQNKQDFYPLKLTAKLAGYFLPKILISTRVVEGRGTKYNLSEQMRKDPHVFSNGVVPGTIYNGMTAVDSAREQFHNFSLPYLAIMPGCDKMVDLFGPVDFHEENCSGDKTTLYLPGVWHNIFYEEELPKVAQIVSFWLKERL